MTKSTMILAGAIGILFAGCSPDLSSPESTAHEYAALRMRDLGRHAEQRVERIEKRLDRDEEKLDLYIGRGTLTSKYDIEHARLDFMQDSLGKITDEIEYDITNVQGEGEQRAKVTIKFWQYEVKTAKSNEESESNNPKAFYLEYVPIRETLYLTRVTGEWRISRVQ